LRNHWDTGNRVSLIALFREAADSERSDCGVIVTIPYGAELCPVRARQRGRYVACIGGISEGRCSAQLAAAGLQACRHPAPHYLGSAPRRLIPAIVRVLQAHAARQSGKYAVLDKSFTLASQRP
jgi:hypothetical protein